MTVGHPDAGRAVCVATMTDDERDELLDAAEANFGVRSAAQLSVETDGDDLDDA